jgi:hypothetical protein
MRPRTAAPRICRRLRLHDMRENMGAAYGRLPDEATRRRIEQFVDSL